MDHQLNWLVAPNWLSAFAPATAKIDRRNICNSKMLKAAIDFIIPSDVVVERQNQRPRGTADHMTKLYFKYSLLYTILSTLFLSNISSQVF